MAVKKCKVPAPATTDQAGTTRPKTLAAAMSSAAAMSAWSRRDRESGPKLPSTQTLAD